MRGGIQNIKIFVEVMYVVVIIHNIKRRKLIKTVWDEQVFFFCWHSPHIIAGLSSKKLKSARHFENVLFVNCYHKTLIGVGLNFSIFKC